MTDVAPSLPVLQLEDREALEAAASHLASKGFKASVGDFSDLPAAGRKDWMDATKGGFLLYLEGGTPYEPAMKCLGQFFGCTD